VNEPSPDESQFLLATLPPTPGQRKLAVAIVVALLVAFALTVPFANTELTPITAFVPALETALLINDLLTSAVALSTSCPTADTRKSTHSCGVHNPK